MNWYKRAIYNPFQVRIWNLLENPETVISVPDQLGLGVGYVDISMSEQINKALENVVSMKQQNGDVITEEQQALIQEIKNIVGDNPEIDDNSEESEVDLELGHV